MRQLDLHRYEGQLVYLDTVGMGYVGLLKEIGPYQMESLRPYQNLEPHQKKSIGPIAVLEPAQLVPHNGYSGPYSSYHPLDVINSALQGKGKEKLSGRAEISLDQIISIFTMPKEKKE